MMLIGSGFFAQSLGQLFGGSDRTVWLSTSINILTTALCPPVSQAADYWGRKWFLIGSQTCGLAGSIIISRAQSMDTIIGGFIVIGICSGTQSLSFAVVSEVLPRRYRPFAQTSLNLTSGLAAIIVICMGGSLVRVDKDNYRNFFYLVAAIFGAATIAVIICYNPPPRELQESLSTSEKLRRLDWVGYLLLTPGLVLFCIALAWSQNPYHWNGPHILAPFIIGVILLAAFCLYEWHFKNDGMAHHDLFKSRNFPIALITIFDEGLVFFAVNTYYTFEVSIFRNTDLLDSGLHFMIMFLATSMSAIIVAQISKRYKLVRWPLFSGFLCLLLFFIIMATVTPRSNPNGFWAYGIISGVGLGFLLPLIVVAGQLSTTAELISIGTGLIMSTRALGATVGLAINNAIFNSALSKNIPAKIAEATLPLGLPPTSLPALIPALLADDQDALMNIPGITSEILSSAGIGLVDAYYTAFRNVWIAAACFVVPGIIGETCISRHHMNSADITAAWFSFDPKKEFNDHIDAPAELVLVEEQVRADAEMVDVRAEKWIDDAVQHEVISNA